METDNRRLPFISATRARRKKGEEASLNTPARSGLMMEKPQS